MELALVSLSMGKAIHRMDHLICRTLTRQQRRHPYSNWLSAKRNSSHIVSWSIAGPLTASDHEKFMSDYLNSDPQKADTQLSLVTPSIAI